jgi:hypothetical protein
MPTYNDGNVPHSSFVLTLGGTAFVAENLNPTVPVTKIERLDELNRPSGKVSIDGFETATVTVQRPASATILPTVGAAAVGPANSFIGTGSWYVTDRGATFTQGDVQKFNITIDKAYG